MCGVSGLCANAGLVCLLAGCGAPAAQGAVAIGELAELDGPPAEIPSIERPGDGVTCRLGPDEKERSTFGVAQLGPAIDLMACQGPR